MIHTPHCNLYTLNYLTIFQIITKDTAKDHIPQWVRDTHSASHVLLTLNSSVNACLYLLLKWIQKRQGQRQSRPEEMQDLKTLTSTE